MARRLKVSPPLGDSTGEKAAKLLLRTSLTLPWGICNSGAHDMLFFLLEKEDNQSPAIDIMRRARLSSSNLKLLEFLVSPRKKIVNMLKMLKSARALRIEDILMHLVTHLIIFCLGVGKGKGDVRAGGRGVGFYWKFEGGWGYQRRRRWWGAHALGACLRGGGELNIFWGGQNAHQDCLAMGHLQQRRP